MTESGSTHTRPSVSEHAQPNTTMLSVLALLGLVTLEIWRVGDLGILSTIFCASVKEKEKILYAILVSSLSDKCRINESF